MNKMKKLLALGLSLAIFSAASYTGYVTYQKHQTYVQQDWSTLSQAPEEIKGKIITLRLLKEDYCQAYHEAWSDTVRTALEFPKNVSYDYTVRHVQRKINKVKEGKMTHYCMFDNNDNKLIGELEIREKNETDPGQFGFWTNENYWGKGRTQEGLKLITNIYFRLHPEAKSFTAHVRLWNLRSYNAMKKFGFKDVDFFYEGGKASRYILEYRKP